MRRTATCRSCGGVIRPKAKDMSVAAAVRLHYWRHHRQVMLAGQKRAGTSKRATKGRR